MKRNKNVIIAIIFSLILLIVIKDIFKYGITPYDNCIFNMFKELRSNGMNCFMSIITKFGSIKIIISLTIALLLLYKNKKTIYYVFINTISIYLLNDFIKFLFHRARPSVALIKEKGYSFPSSHAMLSTLFYGLLIYIVYKKTNNKILRYLLISLLSMLIVLICISRLYFGVHYSSDIIGGFSISIIYIMIFITVYKDFEKRE